MLFFGAGLLDCNPSATLSFFSSKSLVFEHQVANFSSQKEILRNWQILLKMSPKISSFCGISWFQNAWSRKPHEPEIWKEYLWLKGTDSVSMIQIGSHIHPVSSEGRFLY